MRFLKIAFVSLALAYAGCAGTARTLDWFFSEPEEGIASPAENVGSAAGGLLPQPWGDVVLSSIILLQNGWLGGRKIQKKIKEARANGEAPSPAP